MNELAWKCHTENATKAEELANLVIALYKHSRWKKNVWPAKARIDKVITKDEYDLIKVYAMYMFRD